MTRPPITPLAKRFPTSWVWVLSFLILFLAGGLYFIYGYLPEKIAASIFDRSKTRQPLKWNPQEDAFHYEDVTFKTNEGIALSGWWMPSKTKKPLGTVLLTHGIFKNREQMLTRAEFLVKAGYQVLLFDQRGEGLSGESPVSGGALESGDFVAGVTYLNDAHRLVRPLFFMGFSMGAISAIRAANAYPQVDGVIADSPLPNGKSYVSRRTLGGVFTALPGFLDACLKDYDRLTGLSLTTQDLDLGPVVSRFQDVPILYITGEADDLAKSSEVRALFVLTQTHHRSLVYIPEAGHEQTYSASPESYERAVKSFMEEVRNHFPEPDPEEMFKKAKIINVPPKKDPVKQLEGFFKKKETPDPH